MNLGKLMPGGNTQVYQASGEATEQAKLPQQFQSSNVQTSPLSAGLKMPPDWVPFNSSKRAPVVHRRPRMVGMRYLYSRQFQRQPYERVGQPGGVRPRPYISAYNPNDMGPIRNGGFNDALFQAGYPGFNLGLSFKVPRAVGPADGRYNAGLSQGGPQTTTQKRRNVRLKRAPGGARIVGG